MESSVNFENYCICKRNDAAGGNCSVAEYNILL